ncbi:hypothetical protein [Micromonospora sp. CA-244673]|uniref:hypothetical protein n=1 Tax=Micromonospora sp. CA-244673 TaxID=3239958 RepID=UPI003D8AEA65
MWQLTFGARRAGRRPRGRTRRRAAGWRLGLVLPLVATAVLACDSTGGERVTAEVVDGTLVLRFDRACPISYLRLTMPPREGETDTRTVWEIVAEGDAPVVESVTAGVPPDGFRENVDDTANGFPAPVSLVVKHGLMFSARIDTAELADGRHDYALTQLMNEMVPHESRC